MAGVIVLTGERGIGKTTVCRKVIALAQGEGHLCGGILTLSRPGDNRLLLDVGSGNTRSLTLESDEIPAVLQGRFRFDPEALRWGNRTLIQTLPCDLLVVDELGPLEIERGGGWVSAFDVLRRADFALALAVVRPELVAQAQLRLPECATAVLTVTSQNRDGLPELLLEMLERRTEE